MSDNLCIIMSLWDWTLNPIRSKKCKLNLWTCLSASTYNMLMRLIFLISWFLCCLRSYPCLFWGSGLGQRSILIVKRMQGKAIFWPDYPQSITVSGSCWIGHVLRQVLVPRHKPAELRKRTPKQVLSKATTSKENSDQQKQLIPQVSLQGYVCFAWVYLVSSSRLL